MEPALARGQGGGAGRGRERFPRDGQKDAQKNELKPHLVRGWVIPSKESGRFVWRMEAVLDLYKEPHDPKRPVVCFDERLCQLVEHTREPLPMGEGRPAREDHEYGRRGMAHLFMAFEPLGGWALGGGASQTQKRRVRPDHSPAGRAGLPGGREDPAGGGQPQHPHPGLLLRGLRSRAGARALAEDRVRLHAGARLLAEQGRGGALGFGEAVFEAAHPAAETLLRETRAWCEERNRLGASVDWRFTTDDARTKLRKLYPSIEP